MNSRGNPGHCPSIIKFPRSANDDQEGFNFTSPFTTSELLLGIKVMIHNKAGGQDVILCEQVKHSGPIALQWLRDTFNSCLSTMKIPKLWRRAKVVGILKPGKDPANTKSHRPISLLCHTYKLLFEGLVLNRMASLVDQHLIPEQAGFRPGKSCTSQLLNLTQFIEDGYEKGLITGAAFVGLTVGITTQSIIRFSCLSYSR